MPDVVSDHFPIQTTMSIAVSDDDHPGKSPVTFATKYPRIDWSNDTKCQQYAQHISRLASTELPNIDIDSIMDSKSAKC